MRELARLYGRGLFRRWYSELGFLVKQAPEVVEVLEDVFVGRRSALLQVCTGRETDERTSV